MKNIVKEYREKLGITQSQMANQLGVTQSHISMMENDKLRIPESIIKLIKCFEEKGV